MKLKAALSLGIALALPIVAGVANAAPRVFPSQQVHYIRASVAFPVCAAAAAGAGSCVIGPIGSVPYNTTILRVTVLTNTAFNSTTSDVLTLGTNTTGTNIISSGMSVHTQGYVTGTLLATAGTVLGVGTAQTGAAGGFDLYLVYTAAGGGTPNQGNANVIIEYVPNNDGACVQVPLGGTSAGC